MPPWWSTSTCQGEDDAQAALFDSPPLHEKPLLVIAPRDEPAFDRARLQAAMAALPGATWLSPPGDSAAFLRGALASAVVVWAIDTLRA